MSKSNGGNGPRAVALVGPYGSGKTTLLESILSITGAVPRKGAIAQKNTVGDASPTVFFAATEPLRCIAPVTDRTDSSSVVLPLP